jgi:hypothetical protein
MPNNAFALRMRRDALRGALRETNVEDRADEFFDDLLMAAVAEFADEETFGKILGDIHYRVERVLISLRKE